MLANLLPAHADNRLPGHWLAIALFVPALLLKTVIAVRSIVSGEDVARHAPCMYHRGPGRSTSKRT